MRLKSVSLHNFRCFKELHVDLDSQLIVLAALNGQGKTSVLDAIRIALWPYVSAFDVVTGTMPNSGIEVDDVRLENIPLVTMEPQLPASISVDAFYESELIRWSRQRSKVSKGSKTSVKEAKPISEIGSDLQSKIRINADHENEYSKSFDTLLPVIAYYGTGRLWKHRKLTLKRQTGSDFFSRSYAYVGCLDSGSDFKYFTDWFFHLYAADFEQKTKTLKKKGFEGLVDEHFVYSELMDAISNAVDRVVGAQGWKNLSYSPSQDTLVMEHDVLGELKVDQLSDGLKSVIAMTADIAYRCVRLNPQLSKAATDETSGVVVIDEIDMHLHPQWQQTVIQSLREAFPNVQFIVTTHSPQVLSTIRRENIRVIQTRLDGTATADSPVASTYGEPSGDVLFSVMAVDPQPPVAEKQDLQRLTALVDQGLYDQPEALELMQRLAVTLGEQHPQLQRLQRSIKRQQVLKG